MKSNTCVLNMPMNEGTGHPHDSSGNGNNGTTTGAVWTHGTYGYGLYFDGLDDYVHCGSGDSLKVGSEEFTIMTWIKCERAEGVSPDRNTIYNAGNSGPWWFALNDNRLMFQSLVAPWLGLSTTVGSIQNDIWYQVAATVKSGVVNGVKLYIDGAQDGGRTLTLNDGTVGIIGRLWTADYFKGTITRPYLDTRAWTAAEILAEYNASKGVFI